MNIDGTEAFNKGADARIAGHPIADNPYESSEDRRMWHLGWQDVAYNWGKGSKWRKVKPLPEIVRQA